MTNPIDLFGAIFHVRHEDGTVFVEENRWRSCGHGPDLTAAIHDLRFELLDSLASLDELRDDEMTQDAKELREWLRGLTL